MTYGMQDVLQAALHFQVLVDYTFFLWKCTCFEQPLLKQQNTSKDSIGDDMLNCSHMFRFKLPKPLTCSFGDAMLHVCLISVHTTDLHSAFISVL